MDPICPRRCILPAGMMLENTSTEDIIHGLVPVAFNAQTVSDHDELLIRFKADARS
jgi:hypothetical protein